jgi:CO/xanthine dehydrogenase Mo-binding subunit
VYVEGAPGPEPFQAKGVGELANCTVPAALAGAVAQATGARVTSLPVTAEKVWAALRQ